MAGEDLGKLNHIDGKEEGRVHPQDGMKKSTTSEISGLLGSRPEGVRVDQSQSAKLNAGPNMNNPYKWKDVYTTPISSDIVEKPMKIELNPEFDLSNPYTKDSITVIERPIVDNVNKELEFAKTVEGVMYKIHKSEKIGNETTWVEVPNLSFVGDGNPHTVDPGNGEFRIGVTRPGREEVIDKETISLDGLE